LIPVKLNDRNRAPVSLYGAGATPPLRKGGNQRQILLTLVKFSGLMSASFKAARMTSRCAGERGAVMSERLAAMIHRRAFDNPINVIVGTDGLIFML